MVDIFWGLESMDFGLSNAVSDVSLRFLVNFLDQFYGARRKVPKNTRIHDRPPLVSDLRDISTTSIKTNRS